MNHELIDDDGKKLLHDVSMVDMTEFCDLQTKFLGQA